MNKIIYQNDQYICALENGDILTCKRWFERKTNEWHVKLPQDNPTGRTYIREKIVQEAILKEGAYYFENKTTHRVGLNSGSWRTKLTEAELNELKQAEETIERLKQAAQSRVVDKGSVDYLLAQKANDEKFLAELEAKLAQLRAAK